MDNTHCPTIAECGARNLLECIQAVAWGLLLGLPVITAGFPSLIEHCYAGGLL